MLSNLLCHPLGLNISKQLQNELVQKILIYGLMLKWKNLTWKDAEKYHNSLRTDNFTLFDGNKQRLINKLLKLSTRL